MRHVHPPAAVAAGGLPFLTRSRSRSRSRARLLPYPLRILREAVAAHVAKSSPDDFSRIKEADLLHVTPPEASLGA